MSERTYRSIGDVLALLKVEFPDVTISKIRFLESQGLIAPERTPSGYRKFYEADVARLRWILAQQREHFLPLKVIKDRLAEGPTPFDAPDSPTATSATTMPPVPAAEDVSAEAGPDPVDGESAGEDLRSVAVAEGHGPAEGDDGREAVEAPVEKAPGSGAEAARLPDPAGVESVPAARTGESPDDEALAGRVFSRRELARSSGLSDREVDSLEQYGLIRSHEREGTRYYDYKAKVVADIAARFARYGLEARHLRTYRSGVDREVNLFGQAVSSQLRLRNPEAAAVAPAALDDLCELGAELRSVLLGWELAELKGS